MELLAGGAAVVGLTTAGVTDATVVVDFAATGKPPVPSATGGLLNAAAGFAVPPVAVPGVVVVLLLQPAAKSAGSAKQKRIFEKQRLVTGKSFVLPLTSQAVRPTTSKSYSITIDASEDSGELLGNC